jgi:phosphoserine phosphatase
VSANAARFRSIALDVDSTLAGIEGIDWLARLRGNVVAASVEAITERSMRGEIPLDAVYGERLAAVAPTAAEIDALAAAYIEALAPGADATIARLREGGVRVVLISGGLREAILPLARRLGFSDSEVNAVSISFGADGSYGGFDAGSPLTTQDGKRIVLSRLALPRPILAVGDGSTDVSMKGVADAFVAFAGFTRRAPVVEAADQVVATFAELEELVVA